MDTLRVGVIGLGVGEQHLAGYEASPGCRVVAVCDLSPERLAPFRGSGRRTTGDAAEILGDPEIDLVSIASYDDAHYEHVLAALSAGKHVFVEKPLCRTLDELRQIRAAWETASRPRLASNLVLRAAPLFRWLREQVAAGGLGQPYAFDGDYLYGRLHKITGGWRKDVEDYSVMLGGGIHLVDLMLWLTGERPAAVAAAGNRISTEGTAFRYLDYAAATFRFPSGLAGRITANFGSVHRHQHVVRLFGTRGTVISDDAGARLHRSRDPAAPAEPLDLPALPASKAELIPDFVARVLSGEDTSALTQHELDVIAACAAADRALAEGGVVEIEYA